MGGQEDGTQTDVQIVFGCLSPGTLIADHVFVS